VSKYNGTMKVKDLTELGQQLRVNSVRSAASAGSGHPTSAMSAADLMAVLIANHLHYDFADPINSANDSLVFSKGHASTLLYSIFRAVGAISEDELLKYRTFGSMLEGHPTPLIPWVEVATGSLGQGLPIGVGMAIGAKLLDRVSSRIWVLCGDSEMAEGSMWEAFEHAAHYELDNLTAIIDVNRLGQRGQTMLGWDTGRYADRLRAFGWNAIEIDGHDIEAIDHAYQNAKETRVQPTAIVARTIKGKGVRAVENLNGWHGKPLDDPEAAIQELGGIRDVHIEVRKPPPAERHNYPTRRLELPRYTVGEDVATRRAYGEALAAVMDSRRDVVALDGEVSNSTFAVVAAGAHPDRYFEMYIAEQQMIAAAVGLQARGWNAFASTFAAFLSRAYDFIRMAAISRVDLRLVGSHAGVSIGEDGPSQMALEDIASMRAIPSSVVLHPCDANETAKLVAQMADTRGIVFLRTLRQATRVLYDAAEEFPIGGSRVLRASAHDAVTLIGAGITVHEALKAADMLAKEEISARVIDLYSIKPLDRATLEAAARDTQRLVTIEDHYPEGGLGEAVLAEVLRMEVPCYVVSLAVREVPRSGSPQELLAAYGIDAGHVAEAARQLIAREWKPPHVLASA
jgi:transketolase